MGLVIPVLMCGGAGTRLWPVSRESMPKQFVPLIGERSTFQQTLARITDPMFARPIVVTSADFRFIVAEQLREQARVDAADLSSSALQVARINIRNHKLGNRVRAVRSDLFNSINGKYDLIVSNATLLRNMNLTNAFFTLRNPYYAEKMTNFQGRVDGLIKAAKEKDLERATEGYSRVVDSCIACHKLFRREQFRQSEFPNK